jgi:hypothetical protein
MKKVVPGVKIFERAQKAGTQDEDVRKVVKAAQEHAINPTRQSANAGQG